MTYEAKVPLHGKWGDGKYATVSPEDYEGVSAYRWYMTERGYAVADIGDRNNIRMHRFILGLPLLKRGERWNVCVDHINGDKLDNRRENIRVVDYGINNHKKNHRTPKHGAYFNKRYGTWFSAIRYKGKNIRLGAFNNEAEARRAYQKKSLELYGE